MSDLPPVVFLNDLPPASAARNGLLQSGPVPGPVAIVGAGPGDPDLLTVKAVKRLAAADVVIHDKLVTDEILALANPRAEKIFVGKSRARHSTTQDEINRIILDRARAGYRIVRLKGGDPFVFGRGGEEADYLRAHDIEPEIVPGITAATGCAAATGIPLTHRDHAQAVTFVTGHAKDDGEPDLDWTALARGNQTVVVYMGVAAAGRIANRLIAAGLPPSTPVAIVENGTRRDQKVALGSVADLGRLIAWNDINGPALLIVGDVVRAAGALHVPALADAASAA